MLGGVGLRQSRHQLLRIGIVNHPCADILISEVGNNVRDLSPFHKRTATGPP